MFRLWYSPGLRYRTVVGSVSTSAEARSTTIRSVHMAGYSDILVEEDGPVALVTLNRPDKLNAMGGTMMSELANYLGSLNAGDDRIRAVVLTGAGRAFCAGGDVTNFPNVNESRRAAAWRRPRAERSPGLALRDCD